MLHIHNLPNELLLEIFSHLPLKSLIAARGVHQNWRRLVLLANLHPARRKLLELYLSSIESAMFIDSRPFILPHIRYFDRVAYIDKLREQLRDTSLPDEFVFWILEYPTRATIMWIWPGLDGAWRTDLSPDSWGRYGANCLSSNSPQIRKVYLDDIPDGGVSMLGLEVWEHGPSSSWLIIGGELRSLVGQVVLDGTAYDWTDKKFYDNSGWVDYLRSQF